MLISQQVQQDYVNVNTLTAVLWFHNQIRADLPTTYWHKMDIATGRESYYELDELHG